MLHSMKTRLAAVNAYLSKLWHAERIPCWTDYLRETANND